MRRRYLVDAWFFIARIDREDSHHVRVRRLAVLLAGADLVTTDAVLTEMLTYFSSYGARTRADAVTSVWTALADLHVVRASSVFEAALDLYESRPDKEYSLVDCMS